MVATIDPAVRDEIGTVLRGVERDHGVRIVFAVESGSRAWGFSSPDSDYDVRFVYVHGIDWYLSIEPGRDVIELPIDKTLDVSGWDLRKALRLLAKSNPALLEWLESPIVYRELPSAMSRLRMLAGASLHRHAVTHHYVSLAWGQYRRFIEGRETVRLKKYFYSLRPAVALLWIRTHDHGPVPMSLPRLLAEVMLPLDVARLVDDLLEQKSVTKELGEGSRLSGIDGFIVDEINRAQQSLGPKPPGTSELLTLTDQVFREIVRETQANGPGASHAL
jgi:predicted nucleotidyltransferase